MCDTMVALPNVTKDGSIIFAKNSDRQPNEPLVLTYIPRKKHEPNSRLQCTYIEIDQVEKTNELFLYKPTWMWGGEMGTNEFGLTIGNEAVFTKGKVNKTGLLGMDLLRLALERCKTSEEAIICITNLIERYGQGGNCGYEKPFTYHNSFLIVDYNSAWILETANFMWVAKEVKEFAAISNRLTIGDDFDLAHPDVINFAIERGWHKRHEPFHFAKSYSDFLYTSLSGSSDRRGCATEMLQAKKNNITTDTMIDILRSHVVQSDLPPIHHFSIKSVCMHAGFFYGDHATGSYVLSLKKDEPLIGHVTGSSTPCISLFKPFPLFENPLSFIWEENNEEALHFWLEREYLHRRLMNTPKSFLKKYDEDRKQIEYDINIAYMDGKYEEAWAIERQFVHNFNEQLTNYEMSPLYGNIYFKHYWNKQNKRLFEKHGNYFQASN